MGKYAIFLVLALTFSLLTYSYALRNSIFMSDQRVVDSYSYSQANNIAQGAALIVVNSIRNESDSQFIPGSDDTYFYPSSTTFADWGDMQGEYQIIASNQGDTLLTIESVGRYNEKNYIVSLGLIPTGGDWMPNIDQAVHAEESIFLNGSSSIQGDASINSIQAGAVDFNGWPSKITGNLFIGPGGEPDEVAPKHSEWHPGNVEGEIFVMDDELEFEMPEFPQYPNFGLVGQSVYLQGNSSHTLNTSDYDGYYIPEISVESNTTLTINIGDSEQTMYVGNFNISQGEVNIVGDGKLNLYVENDMTLGGSSSVNKNGDVNNLFMFYGGQNSLSFKGATEFNGGLFAENANVILGGSNSLKGTLITGGSEVEIHGAANAISRAVYAPYSNVELKGSGHIYGSVISKTFKASGNAHVVYQEDLDSELPDLRVSGEDGFSNVAFWH